MNCPNGVLEATTTQITNNNSVDNNILNHNSFTNNNICEYNRQFGSNFATAVNNIRHTADNCYYIGITTTNSNSLSPQNFQLSPKSSSGSEKNQARPVVPQDSLMENLQKFFDSQKQERFLEKERVDVSQKAAADNYQNNSSGYTDGEDKPSTSGINNLPTTLDDCLQFQQRSVMVPFMLQSDSKYSSLKSTRVLNQLISCFVVGGECRLCLPQMLALVLPEISSRRVDEVCVRLRITNMQANKEQLQILKLAGALPMSVTNCELITKSNAERLLAEFVIDRKPPLDDETRNQLNALSVAHDCFGGCAGRLYTTLTPQACIECSECRFLFDPENFCRHSHAGGPNSDDRKCHWGFDASNWPFYLHVDDEYVPQLPDEPRIEEAERNLLEFVQLVQSQHQEQQLLLQQQ